MIDNRYPPQPLKIKVPLYKNMIVSDIAFDIPLLKFITSKHQLEDSKILLAESATNALISFLSTKFMYKKKIALPAFFCPKVAYELYKFGYELFFFDLVFLEDLDEVNLDFIFQNKVDIVILPSLFFKQEWNYKTIDKFLTAGLVVIIDLAHTFPIEYPPKIKHENLITLFSFGKNKPVSALAGGGIYYHGSLMPTIHRSKQLNVTSQTSSKFYSNILSNINNTLIEQKNLTFHGCIPLSKDIERKILSSYKLFFKKSESIRSYLNDSFSNNTVLSKLLFTKSNFTNALVIKHESRFKLASSLSMRGIQTTWYYYPLTLIEPFKDCISTDIIRSIDASSKILILPFSIHHTNEEIDYVLENLVELCL